MRKILDKIPYEQALTKSPCVGNCCLDPGDVCLGCYRHIDEITGWHQADSHARKAILERCETRHQKHIARMSQ